MVRDAVKLISVLLLLATSVLLRDVGASRPPIQNKATGNPAKASQEQKSGGEDQEQQKEKRPEDNREGKNNPVNTKQPEPIGPVQPSQPLAESSGEQKLVAFTLWLVVVGGLQFVALIVQAFVFWRTLRAVQSQVRVMETGGNDTHDLAQQAVKQTALNEFQLELSHRPWIAVDIEPASGLIFDQRGAVIMLMLGLRAASKMEILQIVSGPTAYLCVASKRNFT